MKDWELAGPADFVARGPLVGGQVGINKQLGSFVFGLELDGSWADIKGSDVSTFGRSLPVASPVDARGTSRIDSLATFAGRAGIAADRWFVFAKAGISAVHEKHKYLVDANGLVGGVPVVQTAANLRRFGNPIRADAGLWRRICACWSVVDLGRRQLPSSRHRHGAAGGEDHHRRASQRRLLATTASSRPSMSPSSASIIASRRWPDPSFCAVPAAPGTNWTGAYIGAQGGYGWGQTQWPDLFGAVQPGGSLPRFDNSGWLAGGTIGVNAIRPLRLRCRRRNPRHRHQGQFSGPIDVAAPLSTRRSRASIASSLRRGPYRVMAPTRRGD